MDLIDISQDLDQARSVLAARIAQLRIARQLVRDLEAEAAAAQKVVRRHSKRKSRFVGNSK